ncbi:Non-specific lipid-transfer protein 2 [Hibiscus syriacus]|uniref:Non-specific lipid-transfer protein 2 n=1 Tax=Hibiscus syriacus TaxID=106335 RepID=A0A6A2XFJ0_HIBSY|nr:non-specific lipid-transfer protein 2-like [Hibiscus syriacus]KAE8668480.1 Non-specific lipid-transfer protein 2 [Hibiscus syriacus]
MKRFPYVALSATVLVVLVAAVFSGETHWAEAQVTCNPIELSVCLPAITSSVPPSESCCNRLRDQTTCFCGYLNDPALRQFADNPNTRMIARACGVPYPQC